MSGDGLAVIGLSFRYPGGSFGLKDLKMRAPRGQMTAILGPNGAGKTSLLKCLVGLHGYEGSVRLDADALEGLKAGDRARRIAYIPQKIPSQTALSVQAMVEMGRFACARGFFGGLGLEDRRAVEQALQDTGIASLKHRRFDELSGGEMKRVLLARALATGATTLVLDEPSAALDLYQVLEFYRLLQGLRDKNYCIVAVLHDLSKVQRFADRAVLMTQGQAVAEGPTEDVLHSQKLAEVFRVEVVPGGGLGFRALEGAG